MIRGFSGFQHEHVDPYWLRIEFYGAQDDSSWFVGAAFLAPELPADLTPYRGQLQSHAFDPDDALSLATGEVVRARDVSGETFDLGGMTLFWCSAGVDLPADHFLRGIADVKAKTQPPPPGARPAPLPSEVPQGVRPISVEEFCDMLTTKSVLLFTGAGLSVAGGFPDAEALASTLGFDDDQPVDAFVRDVFERPDSLVRRIRRMYDARPTPAHRAIKRLQDLLGVAVWTGNFDGLHQATGTRVRFVMSTDEQFDPAELWPFDVVIAIGASAFGFANFACAYRQARPDGHVIATNSDIPPYLVAGDAFIQGDVQTILPAVADQAAARRYKPAG